MIWFLAQRRTPTRASLSLGTLCLLAFVGAGTCAADESNSSGTDFRADIVIYADLVDAEDVCFNPWVKIGIEGTVDDDGTLRGRAKLVIAGTISRDYDTDRTNTHERINLSARPTGNEFDMPWFPRFLAKFGDEQRKTTSFNVKGSFRDGKLSLGLPRTIPVDYDVFYYYCIGSKETRRYPKVNRPFPFYGVIDKLENIELASHGNYRPEYFEDGEWEWWHYYKEEQVSLTFFDALAFETTGALITRPGKRSVGIDLHFQPKDKSDIEVVAERELIPGHLMYFNKISYRIPAGDGLDEDDEIDTVVRIEGSGDGQLLERKSYSQGEKELTFNARRPGQWYEVFYAWRGDPPTGHAHQERISVSAPKQKMKGSVDFEVGVDFQVVGVNRLLNRKLEINRREPLRIRVQDALHPNRDPAAIARELDIRPVLSLKQTYFVPKSDVESFVSGLSLNFSGIAEYLDAQTSGDASSINGHLLDWNVGAGGMLTGHELYDDGYPWLKFRKRGVYGFEVDISALSYSDGRMPEPESQPEPLTFRITELDANSAFLFEVLIPCLQSLSGVTDAEAVSQWQAVWHCLLNGIESELVQEAIGHNVMVNAIAYWAGDMLDFAFAVENAKPPQTPEELQQQAIESLQDVVGETADMYVVAVEKGALQNYQATAGQGVRLEKGPETIDLNQLKAKDRSAQDRLAARHAPARRIQESGRFVIIPADAGEPLSLDLAGSGQPGQMLVISRDRVVRCSLPPDAWRSTLKIDAAGRVEQAQGDAIQIDDQQAASADARGFAGTWHTNFGVMELTVDGAKATGTFGEDGRIRGALSADARQIAGHWDEGPTHRPPDAGRFVFTLGPDGRTFEGQFGYGDRQPNMPWKGKRVR